MTGRPVRCLLVDNYDSFTQNLAQALACLAGADPVVVRNDDASWRPEYLAGFDGVVISPGPGRPDAAADFGFCPEVIRATRVPLLGVCLGHQGICHEFGGTVIPAPEPVHGRAWEVRHDGDELFAGIPASFLAVRYHSLMAGRIPAALRVIAATPDGLPMAVRHRDRPTWGVQFHPESVGTEHGERLIANFVSLAASARPAGRRVASAAPAGRPVASACPAGADRSGVAPNGEAGPAPLTVLTRQVRCDADAESAFWALYGGSARSFWLDSGQRMGDAGRFSFMGDASGPLSRTVTADVRAGTVTVTGPAGVTTHRGSFFDWLRADLTARPVELPVLPFGFALGWVGYLGYELKAQTGGRDRHRSPCPDASMIFADRAIAFDHETHAVCLLALADGDPQPAITWLDETERRLASVGAPDRTVPSRISDSAELSPHLRMRHDRAAYLEKIAECQRLIRAGETYEVCLTNQFEATARLDPWPAYLALRRATPVPYGGYLRLGELSVLSASPERFLTVTADGRAESKPIKGTRPRGRSKADDTRLRADLAASEKDRAENLMIVDLVRHDLGVTAIPGSVRVERLFDVETFATVHQLVSTVRSRLRPGLHATDCVAAAFPGGSMTGAPKIRTMAIIDDLEEGPRGIYSGALGYFSLSGAADLAITIRTIVAQPDSISYGTGGAIIALSDPAAEYEETLVKAAPLSAPFAASFFGRWPDEARQELLAPGR
jgi:para-aminobenzoate synthetase